MSIYELLNHFFLRTSYPRKFQAVAFLGVHVPLIALLVYLLWFSTIDRPIVTPIIIVTLLATLAGSMATVWSHQKLMSPLILTVESLQKYRNEHKIPELPTKFQDEMGILMAETQQVVAELDALLSTRLRFMAILSHDMRSPLNALMLLSEILETKLNQNKMNSDDLIRNVRMVKRIAEDQLQMMNNVMELIRSESGSLAVKIQCVKLTTLLESVEQTISPIAAAKGVEFCTQLKDGVDSTISIQVDLPKTVQILNNLVHNAVKYAPAGCDGKVRLSIEKNPETIVFRVSDNGLGMDEETCANLFVPFTVATRQGTAMEIGSGLGLWICKVFTEAQGGTISVQSEVNKGSCFLVTLPNEPDQSLKSR